MMKFLLPTLLIFNSLAATIDSDGWASVERPKQAPFEEPLQEEDPSIWVVFAKELGPEKLLIRFPEDPQYTYLTSDELEISSTQEGYTHRLRVAKPDPTFFEERKKQLAAHPDTLLIEESESAPHTLDLFYQSQGKWIWERIHLTPHHLYFLQTTSDVLISEPHQKFVDSLDIE